MQEQERLDRTIKEIAGDDGEEADADGEKRCMEGMFLYVLYKNRGGGQEILMAGKQSVESVRPLRNASRMHGRQGLMALDSIDPDPPHGLENRIKGVGGYVP